jgi:hypothetical protein
MSANGVHSLPELVETTVFTRQALDLWSADEYRRVQAFLVGRPHAGQVIPGSGGLRKIRWSLGPRGKRGGCRVIYAWFPDRQRLYLLLACRKQDQDDLSPDQLRFLRRLIYEP